MAKRVVVFAPHPDDETLGCGGTIASRLNEGYDVSVVFLTDGRYSLAEFGASSGPTPLEMKATRKEEAIRATKILGLREKNLFFLDFEDTTLQKNEKTAQERVSEILQDLSPAEVFFPQENEYNMDHRATNAIIKRAIKTLDLHLIESQYIIAWSFPFYLFLHIMNESMFDRIVSRFPKRKLIHVDISEFFHLKETAMKEYKSQTTLLSVEQKRPALKDSFLKRSLKTEEKFFVSILEAKGRSL
jgi:LmbE family N-acetylglucosaminyl deacetylase